MSNLDNGHSIWIVDLWTSLNVQEILTLRIYSHASYHKSCFADIANVTKIERTKKLDRNSIETSQPSVVKRKAGRSFSSTTQVEKDEPWTTRSKVKVFDRKLCIICQTTWARSLTRSEFKETGIHMPKVSEKLVDKSFFHRMNSITNAEDAVATEVVYHVCCVKAKQDAQLKPIKVENTVRYRAYGRTSCRVLCVESHWKIDWWK